MIPNLFKRKGIFFRNKFEHGLGIYILVFLPISFCSVQLLNVLLYSLRNLSTTGGTDTCLHLVKDGLLSQISIALKEVCIHLVLAKNLYEVTFSKDFLFDM